MLNHVDLAECPIPGEREVEPLRELLDSPAWGGPGPLVERFERACAGLQTRDDPRWEVA